MRIERNELIDKLGLELDFNENETKYNELLKELETIKDIESKFYNGLCKMYLYDDLYILVFKKSTLTKGDTTMIYTLTHITNGNEYDNTYAFETMEQAVDELAKTWLQMAREDQKRTELQITNDNEETLYKYNDTIDKLIKDIKGWETELGYMKNENADIEDIEELSQKITELKRKLDKEREV